jgi:hypothetical protein
MILLEVAVNFEFLSWAHALHIALDQNGRRRGYRTATTIAARAHIADVELIFRMAPARDALLLCSMLSSDPNSNLVECHGQCPKCGAAMRLVRVTPRLGALPELRTFRCTDCGHVVTVEVESSPWTY